MDSSVTAGDAGCYGKDRRMKGLKNKRIIIGGGATGMGAALAARLVDEGARLIVGDINAPALSAMVADLTAKGGIVVAIADKFKLPVHAIGVGEGIEDFRSFAAEDFARNLLPAA